VIVRTASRRVRRLGAFLVLALSVGWALLRRRSPGAVPAAGRPSGTQAGPQPRHAPAGDAAPAAGPARDAAPITAAGSARDAAPITAAGPAPDAGLVTDAGVTPAPAAGAPDAVQTTAGDAAGPPGEVAADVLATDAGLVDGGSGTPLDPAAVPADGTAEATPDVGPDPHAPEPATASGEPASPDNLRAIRGIGPSIERILHGLEITTYRQVAQLEGDELERVRAGLQDFRARVEREDWRGQARELHREKYGEGP
jgi:predicted flap endonuclease-1-like 5' DNA nuclease